MSVIVYSKPSCPQCTATENYLKNNNIPYEKIDITQSAEGMSKVVALGYRSMPVVVSGNIHWSGFDIDMLSKTKKYYEKRGEV